MPLGQKSCLKIKDTLASDSGRFSGIFDITGCEKKLYHYVRQVKKFLFPCPEIRLRHPLLRNREFCVSKNGLFYYPSSSKGMNWIRVKMELNHSFMQIVDPQKLLSGKLNPQRVLEMKIHKNLENSSFFSHISVLIFQMRHFNEPKRD